MKWTCIVNLGITKVSIFLVPAWPGKYCSLTALQRSLSETKPLSQLFIQEIKFLKILQEMVATPDKIMKAYFTAMPILLSASALDD